MGELFVSPLLKLRWFLRFKLYDLGRKRRQPERSRAIVPNCSAQKPILGRKQLLGLLRCTVTKRLRTIVPLRLPRYQVFLLVFLTVSSSCESSMKEPFYYVPKQMQRCFLRDTS